MKRISVLAFVSIFFLALMFGTRLATNASGATTHHVYPGGSIQETLDLVESGETVFVHAGTYYENIILKKSNLTLIGENKNTTVIHGNEGSVVFLKGNNCRIKGFTVQNGYFGIWMNPWTHGHIISDNIISNNNFGVSGHYDCFNVSVCDNVIASNNINGIKMLFSHSKIHNNLIFGNGKDEFRKYGSGIQIEVGVNSEVVHCVGNAVFGNTIMNHQTGVWAIRYSEGNLFFHNNFVNNTQQFSIPVALWNNSIFQNFWSTHKGIDIYSGLHQNETGSDGIADKPYSIDANIQDNYPLMGIFYNFAVELELGKRYQVYVISNSTVSNLECRIYLSSPSEYLQPGQRFISFSVTGAEGSLGFCRVMIPRVVLNGSYIVLVDGKEVSVQELTISNGTHAYLYFTYSHSTQEVVIVPEFLKWGPMLLVLIVLTGLIVIRTRELA